MTFTIEDAIVLATNAHRYQTDKAGQPYIMHPLRVMFSFEEYERDERLVAVLHDVIEDTPQTAETLFDAGVPAHIVEAVVAMSKTDKNMDYQAFIRNKVMNNALARRVKIHDIRDNMSVLRLLRLPNDVQDRMRAKYNPALDILEGR